jgi:hypothetical protein
MDGGTFVPSVLDGLIDLGKWGQKMGSSLRLTLVVN